MTEGRRRSVRPTWKEKIAADTARVQDLPNFITNLPGRCDSIHREGKSWWRCARIAGHEGCHHFATKDWR